MSDKQIEKGALALLKKARRWFNSKDRLVKNWVHTYETAEGYNTHRRLACRACIHGAIGIVKGRSTLAAIQAHRALDSAFPNFDVFLRRHTLKGVRSMYDRAIRKLEKEFSP